MPRNAGCPYRTVAETKYRFDFIADRNFIGCMEDEPNPIFIDVKNLVVFTIEGEGYFFNAEPLLPPVSQLLPHRCHRLSCLRFS